MEVEHTRKGLRRQLATSPTTSQDAGAPTALVPTMGALHAGHLALIDQARHLAGPAGRVLVSIFVNPTQFAPSEDFASYPRQLDQDLALCRTHGADLVFAPDAAELYAPDHSTLVSESNLSAPMEGTRRPGHFTGVCTIVLKLFLLTKASHALFGKKDYQQLAVIRRMVRDLDVPIEICAVDTVREPDGLALSSRNAYLSPAHRAQAPAIRQALLALQRDHAAGQRSAHALRSTFATTLSTLAPDAQLEYLELVDAATLVPANPATHQGSIVAATTVSLGTTRLLDNVELATTPSQPQLC